MPSDLRGTLAFCLRYLENLARYLAAFLARRDLA